MLWYLRLLLVVSVLVFVRVSFVSKKIFNLYIIIKYIERGGVGLLCDFKWKICFIIF